MYFYLDFSENFGTVPHSILLDKLPSCGKGVSGALCFLPKNWLKGRTWRFTLFLCLAFFKSIWFVHLGLLAFLPYFLLVEINCSWGQIFLWYCRALNTVAWCRIIIQSFPFFFKSRLHFTWHEVWFSINMCFIFYKNKMKRHNEIYWFRSLGHCILCLATGLKRVVTRMTHKPFLLYGPIWNWASHINSLR